MTTPSQQGYFPAPAYRPYPESHAEVGPATYALEPQDPYALPVSPAPRPADLYAFQPAPALAVQPVAVVFPAPAAIAQVRPPAPPRPNVGFFRAVRLMLANATNFTGRASRTEFFFATVALVVAAVCWVVAMNWASTHHVFGGALVEPLAVAGILTFLAAAIPHSSLTVRRLHDADLPGALWFLHFLPFMGTFIIAVLCGWASSPAAGHYDDPDRPPATG